MKCAIIVATLLLGNALADAGSPMSKVVQMLAGLKEQIQKDGEVASKQYKEYMEWCRKGNRDLKSDIGVENDDVEDDGATLEKASSDISIATNKIDDEAETASQTEAEIKDAENIRKKENDEFKASEQELVDTVDTLERATNVLSKKIRNDAKGTSLLDTKVDKNDIKSLISTLDLVVNAASLSIHDKNKLTALVQASQNEDSDDSSELGSFGAPTVAAYEPHGATILDMLQDLKQKASSQLNEVRKEEQNARHNSEMLLGSLRDTVKVATDEMTEGKKTKNLATETQAITTSDLAVVQEELGTDETSLKKQTINCDAVTVEYDISVKSSAEEMAAIDQAIEALKSVGDDGRSSSSSASFLQLRSDPANFEVVNVLRKLARVDRDPALNQLVGRVSSAMTVGAEHGVDPLKKVKQMISNMVAKLQAEGVEEEQHKEYCDKETENSATKKAELGQGIETFTAQIDKAKAKVVAMKESVVTLREELSDIAEQQTEADRMRQEQAATYKANKADLDQGMAGVRTALRVLRQYYVSTSEDTTAASFIQQPLAGMRADGVMGNGGDEGEGGLYSPGTPVTQSHAAHSGSGSSILGMLELVESDMSKKLSSIQSEEIDAGIAYKKIKAATEDAKAVKEKGMRGHSRDSMRMEKAIAELTSDLGSSQSQMDAVLQYADNIKIQCGPGRESHDEKQARREAELQGLHDALKMIEEPRSALLQKASALRGATVSKHA